MSKEEILEKHLYNRFDEVDKQTFLNAMDEYAKQEAIEFATWISYANFEVGDISQYKKKGSNYSSGELYNLYLKSKQSKT